MPLVKSAAMVGGGMHASTMASTTSAGRCILAAVEPVNGISTCGGNSKGQITSKLKWTDIEHVSCFMGGRKRHNKPNTRNGTRLQTRWWWPHAVTVPENSISGLLHRLEMKTFDGDWLGVVQALLLSQYEYVRMGYPVTFLVKCLAKALPGLLQLSPRWMLVSLKFSMVVGSNWRPWHSLR
jgi:hypothetical protein